MSAETRRLVEQKVRELGYRPNLMARSLISGRSNMLGLVVPALMPSFFAEVAEGVARTVQARGFTLLLASSNEEPDLEQREIGNLLARGADGLIVASAQGRSGAEFFRALTLRRRPLVLLDRKIPGLTASYVGIDNHALGRMATAHLIGQGSKRVAHISCAGISTADGRRRGYRAALAAAPLRSARSFEATAPANTAEGGYVAMRELLSRRVRPDAAFCFSDPVAAGAMRAVLESGLGIPENVRLIGAGNVQYSDLFRVPLSTIDVNPAGAGVQAAELLLRQIESAGDWAPTSVRMTPHLIQRDSTAWTGPA